MPRCNNIFRLGIKELRSLLRDPVMLALIAYAFTVSIYTGTTAIPETLNKAPIAIVDEDRSPLSQRIAGAFYPPYFKPTMVASTFDMDARMDAGHDTFALVIPAGFQRDVITRRQPKIQLNVDATRISQTFSGSAYVQSIVTQEVGEFIRRYREVPSLPANLAVRARYNPQLNKSWFGAIMQIINHVTMLSIVLAGAALIREREHGTIEHLLVMPVTPFEIMAGKICSMAVVVLTACALALIFIVQGLLSIPLEGPVMLFLGATAIHLFATTSFGLLLGSIARSMPQFGLLLILVLLPMQMLSGATTPRESMPETVQHLMLAAPNTHYVQLAQAVLYRGASIIEIWPQLAAILTIGLILFVFAQARIRKTIGFTAPT